MNAGMTLSDFIGDDDCDCNCNCNRDCGCSENNENLLLGEDEILYNSH